MSSPDAAAGPYAGNDKKPIGGNIMAHASTTRYVATYEFSQNKHDITFTQTAITKRPSEYTHM